RRSRSRGTGRTRRSAARTAPRARSPLRVNSCRSLSSPETSELHSPGLSGCTAGARTSTGAGRAARPDAQGTGPGSRQPDGRFALGAVPRLAEVPPWLGVPFPPWPAVVLASVADFPAEPRSGLPVGVDIAPGVDFAAAPWPAGLLAGPFGVPRFGFTGLAPGFGASALPSAFGAPLAVSAAAGLDRRPRIMSASEDAEAAAGLPPPDLPAPAVAVAAFPDI